ncbi:MAG: hypothetical protein Q4A31_00180 [Corynebacterium sp.]|uniref:hypothetical protein n=1 Tax=Corynebacterium sp. TaxID=1720 RepID=UPI0026DB8A6A|nr:hypothetical protein [Corynebacterium sp.]MDO4760324.1 hypothetical protein [Corynebacterium sp.]
MRVIVVMFIFFATLFSKRVVKTEQPQEAAALKGPRHATAGNTRFPEDTCSMRVIVAVFIFFATLFSKVFKESHAIVCRLPIIVISAVIVGKMGNAEAVVGAGIVSIGLANGVHNTCMSGFMLKRIAAAQRAFQIPGYILVIQVSVFLGFLGAGFVPVHGARSVFVVSGIVALCIGVVGAPFNRSNFSRL